ncbi:outer membrane lipoprotein [Conchiformibius steedae]|uniref:Glycine zipper 2TM domain-containing protein n=1 Tax=Conchiformibius steedae TaxID=153493 RepID=A0A3P2A7S7_9NEIS|nr:glycine zipper 2TM domain-containing protein [Conchiformibius steedae]RRD90988.1 glycine zipper 2TM domain-containing protein [Conchiformibius steedae]
MKKLTFSAALAAMLAVSGCANTDVYGGNVYRGNQAKEMRNISYGTIVSVRPVQIQAPHSGAVGSLGGGIIGGIAGSSVGSGRGSAIMGTVGAIAGSLLGSKLEQKAALVNSLEMVIRKDDGSEIVVVQKQEAGFSPGQRVRLVGNASDVNVSPM